jgi:RNA 2',3'-cyclic 3'-phosphodiesterase
MGRCGQVRVFAALPIPPSAAAAVEEALASAHRLYPRLRWVPAEGMHVTLHFFGECTDADIVLLQKLFGEPELRRPVISCRLGRLGQFPARGRPSVLWVGLEKGGDEMKSYWEVLEKKLAPLGFKADARGFSPHVTVARAGSTPVDDGWNAGIEMPAADFLTEECVLFKSILGRHGAQYLPLARIAFERGKE